jgi:hypothetical protein
MLKVRGYGHVEYLQVFLQMDLLRVLQLLNPIRTHTIFFCAPYRVVFLNLIYTLAVKDTTSVSCSVLYNEVGAT